MIDSLLRWVFFIFDRGDSITESTGRWLVESAAVIWGRELGTPLAYPRTLENNSEGATNLFFGRADSVNPKTFTVLETRNCDVVFSIPRCVILASSQIFGVFGKLEYYVFTQNMILYVLIENSKVNVDSRKFAYGG